MIRARDKAVRRAARGDIESERALWRTSPLDASRLVAARLLSVMRADPKGRVWCIRYADAVGAGSGPGLAAVRSDKPGLKHMVRVFADCERVVDVHDGDISAFARSDLDPAALVRRSDVHAPSLRIDWSDDDFMESASACALEGWECTLLASGVLELASVVIAAFRGRRPSFVEEAMDSSPSLPLRFARMGSADVEGWLAWIRGLPPPPPCSRCAGWRATQLVLPQIYSVRCACAPAKSAKRKAVSTRSRP